MKYLIIVLAILIPNLASAQDSLPHIAPIEIIQKPLRFHKATRYKRKEHFPIQVKAISHSVYKKNSGEGKETIDNKANRPGEVLYFDTLANWVKKFAYGKYHNTDLRVLDYVAVNKFVDTNIVETINYEAGYDDNRKLDPNFRITYFHDDRGRLSKEQKIFIVSNTVDERSDYEYDSLGSIKKTVISSSVYRLQFFDKNCRLISSQNFFANTLRGEYVYTYTDTSRACVFNSHNNDGKDYSEQETRQYDKGVLTNVESKYLTKNGPSVLWKLYYDDLGIIKRIEHYHADEANSYKLTRYTDIKINLKYMLNKRFVNKINEAIFPEYMEF